MKHVSAKYILPKVLTGFEIRTKPAKAVPVFLNMFSLRLFATEMQLRNLTKVGNIGMDRSERALKFQLRQLYLYCFQPFTMEITI